MRLSSANGSRNTSPKVISEMSLTDDEKFTSLRRKLSDIKVDDPIQETNEEEEESILRERKVLEFATDSESSCSSDEKSDNSDDE